MGMQTNNISKNEVLAILETYEGIIKQDWNNLEARARWTEWKAVLRRLEGR